MSGQDDGDKNSVNRLINKFFVKKYDTKIN